MKKKILDGSIMILIAMLLGVIVGVLLSKFGNKDIIGFWSEYIAPLGKLFLKLITMMIVPLVLVNIVLGAMALGKTKSAGKVGFVTLGYYMLTSSISVVVGIGFGKIFKPGLGINVGDKYLVSASKFATSEKITGFWDTVLGMIPNNPIKSLVDANILQIIFFALFLGISLSKLEESRQKKFSDMLEVLNDGLIKMVEKILLLTPFGVFALMGDSIITFGSDIVMLVLKLLGVFFISLFVIHFIMLPFFTQIFGKVNMFKFIKMTIPAQIFAFTTASSMATLPLNTECCKKMGVRGAVSSFVLPLGATVNMNGNAMLYGLVAMFFAQMFGINLDMGDYIAIVITSVLGAIGTAGVPGPSLLVVAVLVSAGIPTVALPLVFGIDRIMDMARTSTNILGDASCAVIVENILRKDLDENEVREEELVLE